MHHMVAHQRDCGYDVIYQIKDHYLGSHIFANLYQIGSGNNNAVFRQFHIVLFDFIYVCGRHLFY